jgi:RNA polymerase sigma-70 factor (ECF subfamily)
MRIRPHWPADSFVEDREDDHPLVAVEAEALTRKPADEAWLARFHAGDREVMEECYRSHFAAVERAVGRYVQGVDRETVIHEVFYRLLSTESLRQAFRGGSLAAWLSTVARNHAIDYARRRSREELMGNKSPWEYVEAGMDQTAEAHILVERFRNTCLPPKWEGVFRTRFLEQRTQRDAARELGISRTTLVYQEMRVRRLLEKFLLGPSEQGGAPPTGSGSSKP